MKEEDFLKRLSELAEWERPMTGPNGAKSLVKSKKNIEPEYDEFGEEIEQELESESKINEGIGPVITKLKPLVSVCPDCNKICEGGRRVESKLMTNPVNHWRTKCISCKSWKDPNTGKFNLNTNQDVQNAFRKYTDKLQKDK